MAWLTGSTPQQGDDPNSGYLPGGLTPQQQQQMLAQALAARQRSASDTSPTTLYGGIARLVDGLTAGIQNYQAAKSQAAGSAALSSLLSGTGRSPLPSPVSMASPSAQTGDSASISPAAASPGAAAGLAVGAPSHGLTAEQQSTGDYLVSHGATPQGASGLVATLSGESGPHLHTGAFQGENAANPAEAAYGIANWNFPRMRQLQGWAQGQGMDPLARDTQNAFLLHEITTNPAYGATKTALFDPNASAQQVLRAGVGNYERPADVQGAVLARTKFIANPSSFTGGHNISGPAVDIPGGSALAAGLQNGNYNGQPYTSAVPGGPQSAQGFGRSVAPVPQTGPYTPLPPAVVAPQGMPQGAPGVPPGLDARVGGNTVQNDLDIKYPPVAKDEVATPPVAAPVVPSLAPAVSARVPPSLQRPSVAQAGGILPGTHWAQGPGPPLLLADSQDAATGGGILSRLLGGGAQAAPSQPSAALANGLQPGISPQSGGGAPAGVPPAPASAAPPGAPPPVAGPASQPVTGEGAAQEPPQAQRIHALYDQADQEYQLRIQQQARYSSMGPAYAQVAQAAAALANQAHQDRTALRTEWVGAMGKELQVFSPGTGYKDPQTGKVVIPVPKENKGTAPTAEDYAAFPWMHKSDPWVMIDGKPTWSAPVSQTKGGYVETGRDLNNNPIKEWVYPPGTPGAPASQAPPNTSGQSAMPTRMSITDVSNLIQKGRDSGLTGDALLNTLPREIVDHAHAIRDGDEPFNVANISGTKSVNEVTAEAVRAAYPGTSAATFAARQQAKKDMAPGGKDQVMIEKLNSAVGHSADQLSEGKQIGNTRSQSSVNAAENFFYPAGSQTGQHIGEFNSLGNLAGPELQSVYVPGGGGVGERHEQVNAMSPNAAPEAMEAVHAARMRAVVERVGAIEHQYNDSMGPNAPKWSGLEPRVLSELQKYANDKLPERFQAKDANGNVVPPATVNNNFQFGAPSPAQGSPGSSVAAPTSGQMMAPADAQKLPPGTRFIGQDGKPYVRH